jgi:2-isopropylmalate synthase
LIARQVQGPVLSVHSRTKPEDIDVSAEVMAKVSPFRRAISLFIGVSPIHRQHKHQMTKAQIIDTVVKSVDRASKHFEVISFGPEDSVRGLQGGDRGRGVVDRLRRYGRNPDAG